MLDVMEKVNALLMILNGITDMVIRIPVPYVFNKFNAVGNGEY